MIRTLTAAQLGILRRSRSGLRVWEEGGALAALQAELRTLLDLGLVTYDEAFGYQIAPQGESCLRRLDV
jgi:hypothetical protein